LIVNEQRGEQHERGDAQMRDLLIHRRPAFGRIVLGSRETRVSQERREGA
jgi:hypothetical protein